MREKFLLKNNMYFIITSKNFRKPYVLMFVEQTLYAMPVKFTLVSGLLPV